MKKLGFVLFCALLALGDLLSAASSSSSGHLVNLSARVSMPPAGMTVTFTVNGTVAKTLVIRVVGPTLGSLGLAGALADPQLTLVNAATGAVVASNDDWGTPLGAGAATASQLSLAFAQVGAFALNVGAKDSAVLVTLAPGTYTAQMAGAGGSTGDVMAEIFDADSATSFTGTNLLSYVALKAPVPTGGTLTAGVVWGGSSAGSVLARAVGPSLGGAGVVADPTLTLLSGAGATLASNDNWGGAPALSSAFAQVGAATFASSSSLDSALVNAVSPGAYTFRIAGGSAGGGTTLLEVYDLAIMGPPAITTQPVTQSLVQGGSATLSVTAAGADPLSYQWTRNGTAITGATSSSFSVVNAQLSQAGRYQVVVSNSAGAVMSAPVEVRIAGVLWGAGSEPFGQFGTALQPQRTSPIPVLKDIKAVAAGFTHSLFLKTDGTLWASGYNGYGQLGDASTTARTVPVQVATGVAAIAAGGNHSLFLRTDGTAWAMGYNSYGQLGDGTTTLRMVPVQVASGVAAIAAGSNHSLLLKTDATVWSMGSNASGQLGDGSTMDRGVPIQIASDMIAIAAGGDHSLLLKSDRTVWSTGSNGYGQLGTGATTGRTSPGQVAVGVAAIAAGGSHSLLLMTDGALWATGYNSSGQLGDGTTTNRLSPVQVATGVAAIAGGSAQSWYVRTDGTVWAVGSNNYGELGDVSTTGRLLPVQIAVGGMAVSAGGTHSLLLKTDGSAWATGSNTSGQLGDGTTTRRTPPVQIATGVAAVAAGGNHGIYLKADGSAWAMGYNSNGQLGDGTLITRTAAVPVATSVTTIAAGTYHSLYVKTDGTAWAMGRNTSGQLGDGTTTNRSSAVLVATGVAAVSAGGAHSLFLKTDGTLWAVGGNSTGQLGDGTTTNRSTPVQMASGVAAACAGNGHSLYLKTDGTLWAVGANSYGQLGDGTTNSRSTPVQVATAVASMSAGTGHSLYVKQDGTVFAVGMNVSGQFGDGTTTSRTLPVQIGGAMFAASAGGSHSLYLRTDGVLMSAGSNYYGQLGDGMLASHSYLVQSASGVLQLAAVGNTSYFIQGAGTGTVPVALLQPSAATYQLGTSVTLNVVANGAIPLDYRWQKNGVDIPGARESSLYLPFFQASDVGAYTVVISNNAGSVTSIPAALTLGAPSVPTAVTAGLINGSVRANVGTGAAALQGVFTVEGTVAKQMLIRAVGPTLATFGVSGALADPRLEIVQAASGQVVAANDDWGTAANAPQVYSVAMQVGAFALSSGSKDAVFLGTFGPGTYRVRVLGAGASTGACLLEIYDADATPRLVQMATRGVVGGAAGTLIQGFVTASVPVGRSYLIRALGPSLGGVGSLSDPAISVYSASGTPLASNDNWGADPNLAAAAVAVGAMPLAGLSKDAALLFTPPATSGTYTVQVSAVGTASGLALLEIFELDNLRAATFSPAIISPPESVAASVAQPFSLGVVTVAKPAALFQWRKDGMAIGGATNATYTVASAAAPDAGTYDVVIVNPLGTIVSPVASVTVAGAHTATQAVTGNAYVAGMPVTVTNTINYVGSAASLGWQVTLPPGWSFISDSGSAGDIKPAPGASGVLEWAWTNVPSSPVTFTYTVGVPVGETSVRSLTASAIIRVDGVAMTPMASPSPLTLSPLPTHSGDTDHSFSFSLYELTRIIELYNTRNGTARTGCYAVATTVTEDGFASDALRAAVPTVPLARYHSADSNRDGKISLYELTRVIELYNYRNGNARTGQYHLQATTEDGYAPGP